MVTEAPWGNTSHLIPGGWATVTELKAKPRIVCTSKRNRSRLSQGSEPTNSPSPVESTGKPNTGRLLLISSSFLWGVDVQVETSRPVTELPLFMCKITVKDKVVLLMFGDQGLGHSYSRTLYRYSAYPKHWWKGIHSGDAIGWSLRVCTEQWELTEKTHPYVPNEDDPSRRLTSYTLSGQQFVTINQKPQKGLHETTPPLRIVVKEEQANVQDGWPLPLI